MVTKVDPSNGKDKLVEIKETDIPASQQTINVTPLDQSVSEIDVVVEI